MLLTSKSFIIADIENFVGAKIFRLFNVVQLNVRSCVVSLSILKLFVRSWLSWRIFMKLSKQKNIKIKLFIFFSNERLAIFFGPRLFLKSSLNMCGGFLIRIADKKIGDIQL